MMAGAARSNLAERSDVMRKTQEALLRAATIEALRMLDAEHLDVTVRIRRAQRVLMAAVPATPTRTDEAARIL